MAQSLSCFHGVPGLAASLSGWFTIWRAGLGDPKRQITILRGDCELTNDARMNRILEGHFPELKRGPSPEWTTRKERSQVNLADP